MAYKIAVASSDGIQVNESFGGATAFTIYEVEGTSYHLAEKRPVPPKDAESSPSGNSSDGTPGGGCGNVEASGCGAGGGCGSGGGCGGSGGISEKVQLLSDCRCIVCQKIGFHVQKQLEKLAIVHFDIDCSVEEALQKISAYLEKVDNHQSLRGIARQNQVV